MYAPPSPDGRCPAGWRTRAAVTPRSVAIADRRPSSGHRIAESRPPYAISLKAPPGGPRREPARTPQIRCDAPRARACAPLPPPTGLCPRCARTCGPPPGAGSYPSSGFSAPCVGPATPISALGRWRRPAQRPSRAVAAPVPGPAPLPAPTPALRPTCGPRRGTGPPMWWSSIPGGFSRAPPGPAVPRRWRGPRALATPPATTPSHRGAVHATPGNHPPFPRCAGPEGEGRAHCRWAGSGPHWFP
jgi:hypothetical protein